MWESQTTTMQPKKQKQKQTLGSKYEKALMILTGPQQNLIPAALGHNWGNKRVGEKTTRWLQHFPFQGFADSVAF